MASAVFFIFFLGEASFRPLFYVVLFWSSLTALKILKCFDDKIQLLFLYLLNFFFFWEQRVEPFFYVVLFWSSSLTALKKIKCFDNKIQLLFRYLLYFFFPGASRFWPLFYSVLFWFVTFINFLKNKINCGNPIQCLLALKIDHDFYRTKQTYKSFVYKYFASC